MKLSEVAKIMYELQEYCRYINNLNDKWAKCDGCTFMYDHVKCKLVALKKDNKVPCDNWGITKADIERLERDENDA